MEANEHIWAIKEREIIRFKGKVIGIGKKPVVTKGCMEAVGGLSTSGTMYFGGMTELFCILTVVFQLHVFVDFSRTAGYL